MPERVVTYSYAEPVAQQITGADVATELHKRLYIEVNTIRRGMFPDSPALLRIVAEKVCPDVKSDPGGDQIAQLFLWQLVIDRIAPERSYEKGDTRPTSERSFKRDDVNAICEMIALEDRNKTDARVAPHAKVIGGNPSTRTSRNLRRRLAARQPGRVNPKRDRDLVQDEEDRRVCESFVTTVYQILDDETVWPGILRSAAKNIVLGNDEPKNGASIPHKVDLLEDAEKHLREVAIEERSREPESLADAIARKVAAQTGAAQGVSLPAGGSPGRFRRKVDSFLPKSWQRLTAASVAIAVAAGSVAAWKVATKPTPLADQVSLENVDDGQWPKSMGTYWVPATADISSMPITEFYCSDETTSWMQEQGATRQWLPWKIVAKNIAGESSVIDLKEITVHGKASAPTAPGFLIGCPTGGQDLKWVELMVELGDESAARLAISDNTYFQHSLAEDDSVGLSIQPYGSLDFTGTATIMLERTGTEPQEVELPMTPEGDTEISWRGVPDDRYLRVEPGDDDSDFRCWLAPGDRDDSVPCTADEVQAFLDERWGS